MKKYVLESEAEAARLERQSLHKHYDFREELKFFSPNPSGTILDAGCGSGVVSRYLADQYPDARILGCDFSEIRVAQAQRLASNRSNLSFQVQNLTQLSFEPGSLDAITCRFVFQHLNAPDFKQVIREFYRCTREGGRICAIDVDGFLFNIYPQTAFMEEVFQKIKADRKLNFHVGREIPKHLEAAGYQNIRWEAVPMVFQGEDLKMETTLISERFQLAFPYIANLLESENLAQRFTREYLQCLNEPSTTLFYSKFIVHANKPKSQN